MKLQKQNTAEERIEYLFNLIKKTKDADLLKNSVKMVEKIRKRYNLRLSQRQKQLFCKFCMHPYQNPKIRFKKIKKNTKFCLEKIVICDVCGKETRFNCGKI